MKKNRDEIIKNRVHSYKRSRIGCVVLAIITLLVLIINLFETPINVPFIGNLATQVLFGFALAYAAHARFQHSEYLSYIDKKSN